MSLLNLIGLTPDKALAMTKSYMDKNGISAILIENGEEVKSTAMDAEGLKKLKDVYLENERLLTANEYLRKQVIDLTARLRSYDQTQKP